jgi:BlaI family penicillinase repressor
MTLRTLAGARVRAPLTELENDVMQAVWDAAPCSVEAVHHVVSRSHEVKETTARTLLRRLEQKGCLRHEAEGRAYVLRHPFHECRDQGRPGFNEVVQRVCGIQPVQSAGGYITALNSDLPLNVPVM